ncbi:hypothetical protein ACH5RR_036522 [Cinchona calisaya]|uniref:Uncharacterized protein n=1 Tax=Cinchona calisaya TaxID=153742 RepID=A0ABD2Y4P6_9GENT
MASLKLSRVGNPFTVCTTSPLGRIQIRMPSVVNDGCDSRLLWEAFLLASLPLLAIRNFYSTFMGFPRLPPNDLIPSSHKLPSFVIFIRAHVEALGDLVLELTLEAYKDLSCEISLDTESSEIEANFLDSELSSFLAPRVMTVRVLV